MKIAFFGSPELCLDFLEEMKTSGYLPILVVTNIDKPVGRKQVITKTPVKVWAEKNNIEVVTPEKINEEFIQNFSERKIDLSVVIAYGSILPEKLIQIPKFGTINVHFSLLPRHRGGTPVEATILAGDTETGVSIQQMVYELDAGDVLSEKRIPVEFAETKESLFRKLTEIGGPLLVETIKEIETGKTNPKPQDKTLATFSKRIKKSEGELLPTDTDEIRWRKYRAYEPWPRTFFMKDGKRFVVTKARYENNAFIIERVIPEGKTETEFRTI